MHVERWVPQDDVLAHAAAIVGHGGSGTTLGALAAGVPQVVVPLFADQPFNAERVAEAGAGLAVDNDDWTQSATRALTAEDAAAIRQALEAVLGDASYRAAAARLAAEMRGLPPVERAFDTLV